MVLCPLALAEESPAEEKPLSPAAWRLHCVAVASTLTMLATVIAFSLVAAA